MKRALSLVELKGHYHLLNEKGTITCQMKSVYHMSNEKGISHVKQKRHYCLLIKKGIITCRTKKALFLFKWKRYIACWTKAALSFVERKGIIACQMKRAFIITCHPKRVLSTITNKACNISIGSWWFCCTYGQLLCGIATRISPSYKFPLPSLCVVSDYIRDDIHLPVVALHSIISPYIM